jgi:hypothetical protein
MACADAADGPFAFPHGGSFQGAGTCGAAGPVGTGLAPARPTVSGPAGVSPGRRTLSVVS